MKRIVAEAREGQERESEFCLFFFSLSQGKTNKQKKLKLKRTVVVAGGTVGFAVSVGGGVVVVVGKGAGVEGGLIVGTGVTAGDALPLVPPFGLHLPHDEWQLLGRAAQFSVPSLARSAQVLDPGVPAGATSLQHLPQEMSHELATEEQAPAPAAATASHEAKPLELGGGASEHIPQAPKVQL